jgi:hypothetical protein
MATATILAAEPLIPGGVPFINAGLARYEIDVNYYAILLLQRLGPARHVKTSSLKPVVEERVALPSQDADRTSIGEALRS